MGATSPPSLPTFARTWVGGDIHGLWAFAATLHEYGPPLHEAVTALERAVSTVVHAAGWQGEAAAAFTTAWERDATATRALATVIDKTADIVGQLSADLAAAEHDLESVAEQATAHHLTIGPDGHVLPGGSTDPAAQQWARDYQHLWTTCQQAAATARAQAAAALHSLHAEINPHHAGPEDSGGGLLSRGLGSGALAEANTVTDYVRGLFALPTTYSKFVHAKLPALTQAAADARVAARENARLPNGRFGPWLPTDRADWTDAKTQLAGTQHRASEAIARENTLTKTMGHGVNDITANSEPWGRTGKVLGDIPIASGALAAVGTGLTIAGDRAHHQSWTHAISDGITSNTTSLLAGAAVGDAAAVGGELIVSGLGAGATGAAVGGVLVGGAAGAVVAVGVGDLVHNAFQEDWAGDIHRHGVVAGIAHGAGHTLEKTGTDLVNMASDLKNGLASAGKGIWNGLAGAF